LPFFLTFPALSSIISRLFEYARLGGPEFLLRGIREECFPPLLQFAVVPRLPYLLDTSAKWKHKHLPYLRPPLLHQATPIPTLPPPLSPPLCCSVCSGGPDILQGRLNPPQPGSPVYGKGFASAVPLLSEHALPSATRLPPPLFLDCRGRAISSKPINQFQIGGELFPFSFGFFFCWLRSERVGFSTVGIIK